MPTGILIDYEFCTGCHSCEVSCQMEKNLGPEVYGIHIQSVGPFQYAEDKWQWAFVPVPTDLCDLCAGRVAAGKKPTCVQHCQAGVMKYGPVEELVADLATKPKQVLFSL